MNFWLLKAAAAVAVAPLWSPRARAWIAPRLASWNTPRLVAIFALSRLVPCVLAMVVLNLGYPRDAIDWGQIAEGRMWSPYDAGFNAILSALWWFAPSPITLVVAMIAAETLAFALFARVVRDHLAARGRDLLTFWLVNPLSLFHIALNGQDEALILLTWCLVLWAATRRRPALGGVAGAVGLFFTKVLGVAACLPLVAMSARELARGLAVFVGIAAVVAAVLAAIDPRAFMFHNELKFLTSGNIWVVPELAGLPYVHAPLLEVLVATIAIAVVVFRIARTPSASTVDQALRLTGAVGATFLLCSPKSPTAWLLMFLPGVLWLLESTRGSTRAFLFYLFLPVAVFEPSLWFFLDQGVALDAVRWGRPAMLAADAVLLTGYAVVVLGGLRPPPADVGRQP